MILADTSVWVEYLRHASAGRAGGLDPLLDREEVLVCGPVVAELLAGTREPERSGLWRALRALPFADLDRAAWHAVGVAAATLRGMGATVALTDLEIAIAAARAGAAVWTADRDFDRLPDVVDDLVVRPL